MGCEVWDVGCEVWGVGCVVVLRLHFEGESIRFVEHIPFPSV